MAIVLFRSTLFHCPVSEESRPSLRVARSASVASVTIVPSSKLCEVPFRPDVVDLPLALCELAAFVVNGLGSPTGFAPGLGWNGSLAVDDIALNLLSLGMIKPDVLFHSA